jgi:hypothetical protein
MTANKYPPGWNEARVSRVLEYYESQSDAEAAAEIESASERTTMEVPVALVPAVRKLIAKQRLSRSRPTKTHNTTLQPPIRAQRKSKAQKNPRAARG